MALQTSGSDTAIGTKAPTRQYVAYGTTVSTDLELGAFLLEEGEGRYSLAVTGRSAGGSFVPPGEPISLGRSHGRELKIHTDREFALSEPAQPWCFEVVDVARFHWRGGESVVSYERLPLCTDPLLAFWLIHIFLPLYLTLEGLYEFIHASAVDIANHTLLFTAPSHGGKSTLTDFFVQQGHRLVSDDKVATFFEDETYFAVPSHPNHRPYRKFEDLGYRVESFSPSSTKIHAFYALHAVEAECEINIERISGHEGFARLLPHYLFNFGFLKARRLRYLGAMLSAVPLFRVDLPWEMRRLAEVYEVIRNHVSG